MNDIYIILSKHFSDATNSEEDKLIAEYRELNPDEYDMLHKLWERGGIETQEFDSSKALRNIKLRSKKQNSKTIPFIRSFRKMAAVAAILIMGTVSAYLLLDNFSQTELIVTENLLDKAISIELEDGTIVWLNKGASLSYLEKFTGSFRDVKLYGKAFFDVAGNKNYPFIINTSNSKITVLGTSFNVSSHSNITEVNVKTGIVEVLSLHSNKKIIVNNNQTALSENDGVRIFKTENSNYLAWKSGFFEFNNASLVDVVRDLNTYYSSKIEIDTTQIYDCSLNAEFKNAKLEDILEVLKTTCDISIERRDGKYRIKGSNN